MEVLRLAYAAVGLGTVFDFTGRGPWRPAFDAAYRLFARHRQLISHVAGPLIDGLRSWRARRTARRMSACSAGACDVQRKGAP
jgi:hypothetical protein